MAKCQWMKKLPIMRQAFLQNGTEFSLHQIFWICPQETRFIHIMLEVLANGYHNLHKLTVVYSPWANGSVGYQMCTVHAVLRSTKLEIKLASQDWKEIIIAITTIINSTGLERLGSSAY